LVLMEKRSTMEIFDLCLRREPGELPISFNLHPQEFYWDCSPFMPLLMHNASLLDVNKDGRWSPSDDLSVLTNKWGIDQRQGNLSQLLLKYIEVVEQGSLLYQKNMTRTETFLNTDGFYDIPMDWLLKEQPIIDICLNTNEHMCSNLEKRGILKDRLAIEGAYGRVERCRELTKQCQKVHGEVWRSYGLTQKQTCGSRTSWFDTMDEITMSRFSDATAWDNISNPERAITSQTYILFLALCLTTWMLVIVEEVREVIMWWMAVVFITTHPPEGKEEAEEVNDEIHVNSLNYVRKALIITLVLLPRTLVVVGLAYYGSLFLVGTDGYTDLILNSVALAFLIEVDEMIYLAVSSDELKESMDKLQPIEGTPPCCKCCNLVCNLPTVIPLMILVFTAVFTLIYQSYNEDNGKLEMGEAFQCLCHGEGVKCVAAQVWGGDAHLDPKLQPGV